MTGVRWLGAGHTCSDSKKTYHSKIANRKWPCELVVLSHGSDVTDIVYPNSTPNLDTCLAAEITRKWPCKVVVLFVVFCKCSFWIQHQTSM